VIINSERELEPKYEKYRKVVKPNEFVHLIAFADIFISDSQTMSMEAGYLGTPYIRFNDFVGKISYLDELENKYKLGYGILTKDKQLLFDKIDELLKTTDLKKQWLLKQSKMLTETIDLSKFMIWLFENYPQSVQKIQGEPNFINEFK